MMPPIPQKQALSKRERIIPGPGLAVQQVAGGTLISLLTQAAITAIPQNNSGGTVLVLDKTNPTITWDRDRDKCPVRYGGAYVKWDSTNYKLINVYRLCEWDKGGNLKSIGAEQTEDIVSFEECA